MNIDPSLIEANLQCSTCGSLNHTAGHALCPVECEATDGTERCCLSQAHSGKHEAVVFGCDEPGHANNHTHRHHWPEGGVRRG